MFVRAGHHVRAAPHELFHLLAFAMPLAPALDEAQEFSRRAQELSQMVSRALLHGATEVISGKSVTHTLSWDRCRAPCPYRFDRVDKSGR
jgi:hypothetical protein